MKKLIYLNHEPLTENTKRLWMLDELSERGVEVNYWDIGRLLNKDIDYSHTISDYRLTVVDSFTQLRSLLNNENLKEVFFVDEFPYFWKNVWLRVYLKIKLCRLIRINVFYYSRSSNISGKTWFYDKIRRIPAWSLSRFTRLFKLQDYEAIFSPFEKGKNAIKTNLPDYETYRRNLQFVSDNNTIVFIDEYFPNHPDLKILYDYDCTDIDIFKYRRGMNALFDSLEKRYKKRVIIAAHPKSKYDGSEFNGREIIYGQTCQLILSCSIVVSHSGLADSYAILANKPMIFVFTEFFNIVTKDGFLYSNITRRASLLGMRTYNIDKVDLSTVEAQTIPNIKREQFIYSYLTSKESENSFNADIIANYLRNA